MTDHISDKKPPLCGKIVKTVDNNRLPCLRPQGHELGCNPFSDSHPDEKPKTAKGPPK